MRSSAPDSAVIGITPVAAPLTIQDAAPIIAPAATPSTDTAPAAAQDTALAATSFISTSLSAAPAAAPDLVLAPALADAFATKEHGLFCTCPACVGSGSDSDVDK